MSRPKKNACQRVKSNLLEAEVYVRYPYSTINGKQVKRYVELRETVKSNGIVQEYVTCNYPITPESVNSYADSANYRKNPEVITQAKPRTNLGDISEVQKVLGADLSELRSLYTKSNDILQKIQTLQAQQKESVVPHPAEGGEK